MRAKSGFTLIELSIVIVVIALIIAGVTAGKGLVQQAYIRNVITDLDKYKVAANAFKMQYRYLPGDITNATSYFGSTSSAGDTIRNGNGDGRIAATTEAHYFWQHLYLSGLIPNYFNGSNVAPSLRNVTSPATYDGSVCIDFRPYNQTLAALYYNGSVTSASDMGSTGSYITIGRERTATSCGGASDCTCNGFVPLALSAIDNKIDDGIPQSGKIKASVGPIGGGSCWSGSNYSMSNTAVACVLINSNFR